MTQDEIIRMAREAGFIPNGQTERSWLERFAALVAAYEREKQANQDRFAGVGKPIIEAAVLTEREACAKVCDAEVAYYKSDDLHFAVERAAAAIRARGENGTA